VLLVCQEFRANGALPIARSRRRNGAHIENRAQRRRLTAGASQARDDIDNVAGTYAIEEESIPPSTIATTSTPATTRVQRRGRQPQEPNSSIVAPRTRKTRRPFARRG
jgi:hypothetical protein